MNEAFKMVALMNYRLGTKQDIPILCQLRKQQLIDEGLEASINIDEELNRYFEEKIGDGSLVEWLLEVDGTIIATAAILFIEFPPSFTNQTGMKGYITNMYTAADYRGQGISTTLLSKLVEEAKKRGVHQIFLSASTLGKPVYQKFGFVEADYYMTLEV